MTEGIWAAIIGVAGTLLGTFLGWILNSCSNSGRLKVSLVDCFLSFEKNISGIMGKCDFKNSQCFSIQAKISIYNNSPKAKIMKNIKIQFLNKSKKVLKEIIPFDEDFTTFSSVYNYKEVCPLNIKPFTIIEKQLKWYVWKQDEPYDYLEETKTIVLNYINEKEKTKELVLKNIDVNEFFVQNA